MLLHNYFETIQRLVSKTLFRTSTYPITRGSRSVCTISLHSARKPSSYLSAPLWRQSAALAVPQVATCSYSSSIKGSSEAALSSRATKLTGYGVWGQAAGCLPSHLTTTSLSPPKPSALSTSSFTRFSSVHEALLTLCYLQGFIKAWKTKTRVYYGCIQ